MNKFEHYFNLREEQGKPSPHVTSKVKLQKGGKEFAPFTINKATHSNLRYLVKAFAESDKVGLGYTTIEKNKGEVEPKIKRKNLWLTGGAVRDHLKGKTPKDYNLVTDATPSEIRIILKKSEDGFKEVKPRDSKKVNDKKYKNLPQNSGYKEFYACRWDNLGKELEICVEINGESFRVATIGKHSKSNKVSVPRGEFASSVEEDSQNRDFTVNAMYIPLTTYDGENSDLIDPHGGAHHLKSGKIVPIGSMNDRLKEDPTSALKYINLSTRFGDGEMPEDHKAAIYRYKDLDAINNDDIRTEFISGLEHQDNDPKKYVKAFSDSGLLEKVFPNLEFDLNLPKEFIGDRWLAPAWILKDNDPEQVQTMLIAGGWPSREAMDISYLIKMYHWADKNSFDPELFYDIKKATHNLTNSKIRQWMQLVGKQGPELDAFINHDDSDISSIISNDDGSRTVNPEFVKVLGRSPVGKEFSMLKKLFSTKKWVDSVK